jgi:DNA-binding NarL/FixJ family response regulator
MAEGEGEQEQPERFGASRPLSIYLVEDHAVVSDCLRLLLDRQPDMQVVGQACTGSAALVALAPLAPAELPAVVVMDLSLPEVNGIEMTRLLLARWPDLRLLALTQHEDKEHLSAFLLAGGSGYVLKRSAANKLTEAIRMVAAGNAFIDPLLTAGLVKGFLTGNGRRRFDGATNGTGEQASSDGTAGMALSAREEEVLHLVAQGYTNKEIGVKLAVNQKTVETYKVRACKKLELDSRADVVRYAREHGWLQEGGL